MWLWRAAADLFAEQAAKPCVLAVGPQEKEPACGVGHHYGQNSYSLQGCGRQGGVGKEFMTSSACERTVGYGSF